MAHTLFLINHETGERHEVTRNDKGDVDFPEQVRGWSDVLDARHTPYTEKTIEELRHFTYHVHKSWFLINEHHISFQFDDAPPSDSVETNDDNDDDQLSGDDAN